MPIAGPQLPNPAASLLRITAVSFPPRQSRPTSRRSRSVAPAAFGAILGIATALVALGVAQAVAAFISSQVGEPVDAVGELSINHTPPSVKNFAIREFGSNDKTVLVWGIRAVLIIFAIVIGILALRKLWHGLIGLAVFIAIGVYAAESQPTSRGIDALPTLVGGLAAALFMWRASEVGRRALTYRAGAPGPARDSTARHAPAGCPAADRAAED